MSSSSLRRLLEDVPWRCWHHSAFGRFILTLEIVDHLRHCHPLDPFVLVDVLDQPLMHEQDVWSARHVWMNGHWENEFIILSVKVVEMVLGAV